MSVPDSGKAGLSGEQRELPALLLAEEGIEAEEAGIPRRSGDGDLPLSFPQQRLWFLQQLDGGAAYNVPSSVHLDGILDPVSLAAALTAIVGRHESLRTSFALQSGQPVQRIGSAAPLPLPQVDLRALPAERRREEARRVGTEEIHRPFDLARAPLLRSTLVRLDDREHVLFLVLHHIASDLWSRGVLLRELGLLYRSALAGTPSPLAPLPIQYADFSLWQRREVERIREPQLAYWRERLAGVTPLGLPTDRPRGAVQGSRGRRLSVALPRELSAALEDLARRESKTLFMTLLAGFQALLFRSTGQEDVAVGTPVTHRKRVETEGLIGMFLNTLVLRTDLSGEPSFRELLARVHAVTVGAYAHDDLPFEALVEELQPERDLGRTPLFQVVFSLGNAEAGRFDLAGTSARPFPLEDRTAKFELNLLLVSGPSGLTGQMEHSAELFDRTTIERLIGHFERLLAGAAADPGRRITELPLLSDAEGHQLLLEWNDTAAAYAPVEPLYRLIERQAERTPEAPALICEDRRLSYAELNAQANRLARHLRSLGVGPGVVAGLSLERSVEMAVGLLAVLKAGGAYLPVDPEYPEERRAFLLADSAVPVLLTQERLLPELPAVGTRVVALDRLLPELAPLAGSDLAGGAGLDDVAYVIYTSGSTGRPKGVQVPHRGIVNRLHWMQQAYGLDGGDRVLQKTPFSFDVSVWELFWPLMTGACLVMARPGGHRDPAYLVELIRREAVTTLHFVPSMLRLFVEEPGVEGCHTLRRVICSGEALPFDLAERWWERSPAGLHNLYGPTEASVDVTFWPCRPDDRPPVPIGRPVANTAIHLLDRGLRPVPIGVPAELYIGGVQLGRGYLGRPALSAERFVPDPLGAPGGRLYKTGDLARRRTDGTIEYLGRIDHQVKVRGFRIEPGEIEAALAEHPAVAEAAVVPREDPPGQVRLVAYLVAGPGEQISGPALRRFLEERLPEHMIPSFFVALDALPLSPNGKLDRRALPAPGEAPSGLEAGYAAPETAEEEVLAAIWARVTGVERVGINDNFFALGGDSIRSLQVVGLARERGLDLTLQQVFQHQTVAALARQAAVAGRGTGLTAAEPFTLVSAQDRERLPAGLEDAYPVSVLQAGMLYHMALAPEDPPYHNVDAWLFEGPFEAEPFERALNRVVARHAVLRTSFDLASFSEPLQLVHPAAALPLEVEDLRPLPEPEQERALGAYLAAEKRRLFAGSDVPQLRCRICRAADDRFWLVLTENHAIWDGWSLHATLAELFGLYLQLRRGEDPEPQPAPPVGYRELVALERAALESEECRAFWRRCLEGSTVLSLPAWPAQPSPGPRLRVHRLALRPEAGAGLRRLARAAAVPLKSVALAAHLRALGVAAGRRDVLTGLVSNGRPEVPGGDEVRGLFLNVLPFRLRPGAGTWIDLARDTFEAERAMLPFRRYPLATLQKERGGEPLFDQMFNYLNFHVVNDLFDRGELKFLRYRGVEGTHFRMQIVFFPAEQHPAPIFDIEYDAARIPPAQVAALAAYHLQVFEAMAADPEGRQDTALLLSAAERQQCLVEHNDTGAPLSPGGEGTLHDLVAAQAARTPRAIALVAGEERWTYERLLGEAHGIARHLRGLGAGPEVVVGVCLERGPEMVAALLGVLLAGGTCLPLDPGYPAERLRLMIEDSGAPVALTRERLAPLVTARGTRPVFLERLSGEKARPAEGAAAGPGHAAYLIYTSGSTGRPKGVVVEHRSAVALLGWAASRFSPAEMAGVLAATSICFDLSVFELFAPLATGGTVILAQDVLQLAGLAAAGEVTLVNTVPSALAALLDVDGLAGSVRTVVLAGEPLRRPLVEALYRLGPVERVYNLYGPTEDTVYSTWELAMREEAGDPPIGRPVAGSRAYVLDADLDPVPALVLGELYLGGAGLARGYLRRPEVTAERFVPHPFAALEGEPGARLYRTGDLVRRRLDGGLEFLGRADHQVKVRGYRIEPGEIEGVLTAHPGVREAVVVARPAGEGEFLLAAYLVPAQEEAPEAELRAWLAARLPEHMVPARLVALPALPRTPNGKVDRKALPELRQPLDVSFVAPRTPAEEGLAEVWREVLRLDKVGVHDNFFALGGDSLRSIRLLSRANRKGFRLAPRDLYEHPTIAGLARLAGEAGPEEAARPEPAPDGPGHLFERLGLDPAAVEDVHGLTPLQHGMLLFHILNPGSAVYFSSSAATLHGDLDPDLLRRAWERLVERHAALRSRFAWEGLVEPLQIVARRGAAPWRFEDWRGLAEPERTDRLRGLLGEEMRALDLARSPVTRLALVRLEDEVHRLVWVWHHAVLDGWSAELLSREREILFASLRRGEEPDLPPAPPFRAYLDWLARRDPAAAESFWRSALEGLAEPTPLPAERSLDASVPSGAARQRSELSLEATAALAALARQHGLTPATLVAAAWAVLLGRYSGEEDVVFGMVSAGRPPDLPGVEAIAGVFLATLPVRVRLAGGPLLPWLLELQESFLRMREHEHVPLSEIRRWSPLPAARPLFESLVIVQPGRDGEEPAQARGVVRSQDREAYPLSLFAVPGERLSLRCSYDVQRFEDATVARLLAHLEALFAGMAAAPEGGLADLPLLSRAERQQLLVEWNDTEREGATGNGFSALWEAQARRAPETVAAVEGGRHRTYGELDRACGRLARRLAEAGAGPGAVVALLGPRGLDLLTAILAVFRVGGAYLPLDPSHPPRRWARLLEESGARLAFAGDGLGAALAAAVKEMPRERRPRIEPLAPPALGEAGELPRRAAPEGLAYVIYTSGSTGVPKGAMVEQRGMLNHLRAKVGELGLTAGDVVAQTASQCFDISVWQFLAALLVGGRVAILEDEVVHDPRRLAQAVNAQGVTILETVPSLLRLFLDEVQGAALAPLRWLIPTGEALPPDLCRLWLERFPEVPLLNAYGPTECSDDVSHQRIVAPPAAGLPRVPIGRPLPGLRLYVLDHRMRALPSGVPGELCVGGVGVGRGYLGDPARTAERFVPDPFSRQPGGRLYRTGDLARHLPGGELDFLGRLDHQVKLRGYRIELGEIEAALRQNVEVGEAAVLLREDRPGDARLVAYVVAAADASPTEEGLRERLRERLPEPMVPSAVLFLPALPLTPNGKLDRKALPAPGGGGGPERASTPPRTAVEEIVAGIWSEVLGLAGVGVEDDFFELGGHSLRAIQVTSRIRNAFGLEIELARLFEATTLASLAAAIEEEIAAAAGRPRPPALCPAPRGGDLPLSFSQRRQWFLDQLEPGNPDYNMPGSVRLAPHIEPAHLESALGEILRRHEVLRTTFTAVNGEPRQIVAPAAPFRLPVLDLRGLPANLADQEGMRVAREEFRRPFDLARGPLVRFRLLLLAGERLLLFPMHHIASDGWSMAVLQRELTALSEASLAGRPSPLAELPIQYADYAVWQREWLRGEVLEAQLAYWREQLQGAPPRIDLPFDRPRPALQTFRGARQQVALPAGLGDRLKALSRRQGGTLFMTFLGAFGSLLSRHSGDTDISVGTYTAGRNRPELEGLIGFFVNTLVLRCRLAPGEPFSGLLGRLRQTTLGAFAHQDLPFEKLLEELRPERNLSHTPLFQVMLEFQNMAVPGSRLVTAPEGRLVLGRANFDLTLWVRQVGDGLGVSVGYNRDLFDDVTIARLIGHCRALLEGVSENAARPLADLPLLPEAERHQLAHEWSRTSAPPPDPVPVHKAFEARAALAPEALAVVSEGTALSYGELDRQANRVAHRLLASGAGPEARVGICLDRSPEMLAALLGVLKAGAAYVPLDPAYPAERLELLAADSRCAVVLTRRRWAERLPAGPEIVLLDDAPAWAGASDRSPAPAAVEAGHLAYVIYTSGSAGRPKGVEITHGSLASYTALASEEMEVTAADRVLQFASLSFDAAAEEIFPALSAGAALVLRDDAMLGSPAVFFERCARAGVTVLDLPTAFWAELATSLEAGGVLLPPSVRLVIIGGEKAPSAAVAAWRRTVGARPRLLDTYGPTEATIVTTVCDLSRGGEGTLGFPVRHARTHVADPELRLVPIGAPGELLIGGAGLARGYLDRPELTAGRFVPDPWGGEPGGRLYRSGDLVRLRRDGRLQFLGRIDRQVKVRGFRVELGEIEEALRRHPAVREAAVMDWPDGEGRRLAAYAVLRDGAPEPDLRRFLRERLPEHMIPASFDRLEALPLTTGGKVDRRALPAPDSALKAGREVAPPETEVEEQLLAIWREVLRIEPIGIRDNFFEIGGHSLLATQVLARVRDRLEVSLSLLALFEMPTIEELALEIEEILLDRLESGEKSARAL